MGLRNTDAWVWVGGVCVQQWCLEEKKTVPESVGADLDRLQCLLEGSRSNRWDVEWLKSFVTTVNDLLHFVDHFLEPLMQYVSILSMAEQWRFTSTVGNWRKCNDLDSIYDITEWLNSLSVLTGSALRVTAIAKQHIKDITVVLMNCILRGKMVVHVGGMSPLSRHQFGVVTQEMSLLHILQRWLFIKVI